VYIKLGFSEGWDLGVQFFWFFVWDFPGFKGYFVRMHQQYKDAKPCTAPKTSSLSEAKVSIIERIKGLKRIRLIHTESGSLDLFRDRPFKTIQLIEYQSTKIILRNC
jgi:hypothetical protein